MIVVNLSKQQAPDADPKAIQQLISQQIQIEQEIQEPFFTRNYKSIVNVLQNTLSLNN